MHTKTQEAIKGLVYDFINGQKYGFANHVQIAGDMLIHYNTIIAERTEQGFLLNVTKYTRTTSKIQNMISSVMKSHNKEVIMLDNIERDTTNTMTTLL
jgi:hypothetical protein